MDWVAEMRAGMEKMAKACAKNEDWRGCNKCPFTEFCDILMAKSIKDGHDYDTYTPLNWLEGL
ncbi:MAG: hypothetical protein J6S85_17665 [Methanobrevibacter sp.]|nr:hypothetical protein [Methanobrevibacter sp.]